MKTDAQKRVLAWLATQDEPVARVDVEQACDLGDANYPLSQLLKRKHVEAEDRSHGRAWSITAAGRTAAAAQQRDEEAQRDSRRALRAPELADLVVAASEAATPDEKTRLPDVDPSVWAQLRQLVHLRPDAQRYALTLRLLADVAARHRQERN